MQWVLQVEMLGVLTLRLQTIENNLFLFFIYLLGSDLQSLVHICTVYSCQHSDVNHCSRLKLTAFRRPKKKNGKTPIPVATDMRIVSMDTASTDTGLSTASATVAASVASSALEYAYI